MPAATALVSSQTKLISSQTRESKSQEVEMSARQARQRQNFARAQSSKGKQARPDGSHSSTVVRTYDLGSLQLSGVLQCAHACEPSAKLSTSVTASEADHQVDARRASYELPTT